MLDSKTVSLVIGTYNPRFDWLENAIKSSEGLFDETIIVDDGSEPPVPNSSVRHDVNKGFYATRNTGIEKATSEWIATLDDDDEFIPEHVKILKDILYTIDADIIHFPCILFGDQNGMWGQNADMDKILESNQIPSGSWFRKSAWEKLGGFQYPLAEDWDFWARATKHKLKFKRFSLPIYKHRMRKGSLSSDWVGDKFLSIREDIRKNHEKERV